MYTLEGQLENASVMIDALRCELHRIGKGELARQFKGLEVTCPESAAMALAMVLDLPRDARTIGVCRTAEEALRVAAHRVDLAS